MNHDRHDPGGSGVGVLGATSLVGRHLLTQLAAGGRSVIACSRSAPRAATHGVSWRVPVSAAATTGSAAATTGSAAAAGERIPDWIALCPIWAIPEHVTWLESLGIERLVAVSSQSVITKRSSPHAAEREIAARLAAAEAAVAEWATGRHVGLCILRPTMIYDGVHDGNVAAIASFLARPPLGLRGFFPVCGPARGLRQPVHADDVAAACLAALDHPAPAAMYAISGGEILGYREMVERIGQARGRPVRIVEIPPAIWRIAECIARRLGRGHGLPAGAAARMNDDLSCDHVAASRDLGFRPRSFLP